MDRNYKFFQLSGKYRRKTGERFVAKEGPLVNEFDLTDPTVYDEYEKDVTDLTAPHLRPHFDSSLETILIRANGLPYYKIQNWLDYHYQKTSDKVAFYDVIETTFVQGKSQIGTRLLDSSEMPITIDPEKLHELGNWLSNHKDVNKEESDLGKIKNIFRPLTEKDANGHIALSTNNYELLVDSLDKFLKSRDYIPNLDAKSRIHFEGDNKYVYSHFYHFYESFKEAKGLTTNVLADFLQHLVVGKRSSKTGKRENLTGATINTYIKVSKSSYNKNLPKPV